MALTLDHVAELLIEFHGHNFPAPVRLDKLDGFVRLSIEDPDGRSTVYHTGRLVTDAANYLFRDGHTSRNAPIGAAVWNKGRVTVLWLAR